ncbi:MAG: VCBS repeat-containing protein [Chitinophagaceae bacterium]|nr:VCBS repeat-containing protein [Chitinophagaceae bacterium]
MMKARSLHALLIVLLTTLLACKSKQQETTATQLSFTLRTADETGLQFANTLKPTADFNMFNYMYFYNGAGVATADFNNDGLQDVFFAGNQQANKMFLNKGQLKFEDVTTAARIPNDGAWSTGVSVVDINSDSLPDLYVCRASNYEILKGKNQLLVCKGINNGVPVYEDEAAVYGLDFAGLSTQAVFFDYDMDGDLDMFLLNHAPSHVGRFAQRSQFLNTYDAISGDRLYRRDGNRFTDVTKESGINSSAIGYGLGVAVSDINLDGWPDIYVGNDFHENDYLYINTGDGKFVDEIEMRTMHTSQFTMGVDVADVTNDGFPEIISMDMLPADHYMQKRSLGEDSYDIFQMKLRYGYHPFFTRNNLQLNRRNNLFSEVGLYSGIAATDWSWSCLWTDFDNDGWKDLFISNGIPKRLNDIDWVNFISNDNMQRKMSSKQLTDSDFAVIDRFPEIKLPNHFFRNTGDAKFNNESSAVSNSKPTFSNGAAYADFDNDGDIDMVVNNIADAAMLYENTLSEDKRKQHASLQLKGAPGNEKAYGAKLVLYQQQQIRTYEKQPVHGYMSSMDVPLHVGLNGSIDSALLIWPDRTVQRIQLKPGKQTIQWQTGLPRFMFAQLSGAFSNPSFPVEDLTVSSGLWYDHTENLFQEFNREQLIPHMTSTDGPALAVGDLTGDGLDDVFFGASRGFKNALFIQQANGRFVPSPQVALAADSMCEDVDACMADVNGDGKKDLIVASGGNEFYGTSPMIAPRVYLNTGNGLQKKEDAFNNVFLNAGSMAAADFNGDGKTDLFIGGRCEPFAYGKTPRSYLLQNDGTGKFTDVTATAAPDLATAGMITHARWADMTGDTQPDLLISSEWQPLQMYVNNKGKLSKQLIGPETGWWNMMLPVDINADGQPDIIAGNLGLNSRLTASSTQPLRMYVTDVDGNGTTEQMLTYYLDGKEVLFAAKDELQRQLPILKKQYLYAEDFAKANLADIFPNNALSKGLQLSATSLANSLYLSKGKGQYEAVALPWLAQLSCYKDACVVDANGDALPDVLLAGNFYDNTMQLGRNDADFGTLLINEGKGKFRCELLNGMIVAGESRKILPIKVGGRQAFVIARNNAPAVLMAFSNR